MGLVRFLVLGLWISSWKWLVDMAACSQTLVFLIANKHYVIALISSVFEHTATSKKEPVMKLAGVICCALLDKGYGYVLEFPNSVIHSGYLFITTSLPYYFFYFREMWVIDCSYMYTPTHSSDNCMPSYLPPLTAITD